MNATKLTLAALLLGASLTPALAESHDAGNDTLAVYRQSVAAPATVKMVEGRQAAPIVTAPKAQSGVATYLDNRIMDQNR